MSVEHWVKDSDIVMPKYSKKTLSWWYCFHKSHIQWAGIETLPFMVGILLIGASLFVFHYSHRQPNSKLLPGFFGNPKRILSA